MARLVIFCSRDRRIDGVLPRRAVWLVGVASELRSPRLLRMPRLSLYLLSVLSRPPDATDGCVRAAAMHSEAHYHNAAINDATADAGVDEQLEFALCAWAKSSPEVVPGRRVETRFERRGRAQSTSEKKKERTGASVEGC